MRKNALPQEKVAFILQNWSSMEYKDIALAIGCTKKQVEYIIHKHYLRKGCGHHKRKYKYQFNHSYFEQIDTPNKAYITGFILADGNICLNDGKYRLTITLKDIDIEILHFIIKELDANIPIKYRVVFCNDKPCSTCGIIIDSKKMITDLINLGIKPRKSYLTNVPIIPQHLLNHFLRGLFDGDGCIYIHHRQRGKYNNTEQRWQITAKTQEFLQNIKNVCGITIGKISPCSTWYVWSSQSLKEITLLYHFMYDNATFYLKRKYLKFQEIIR